MATRLWLHIGTEKTGTTSIQSFLADNRAALAARGFTVPVSPGKQNHLALTGYAQADETIDDVRISHAVRTPAEVPPYRARVEQELFAELADVAGQIVLSNEHLSSRLRTRPEIARLKTLLDRVAPATTVVVYLRNQIDFLASWYSTSIKAGGTRPLRRPLPRSITEMMDYGKLLADWSAVFGQANLVVRRFVADDFPNRDLIADFGGVIGLDTTDLALAERRNEALDVVSLAFMREFNRHVPRIENGRLNPLRNPIVAVMESLSDGPTYAVPRSMADAIARDCAAANAAIARDYFAGRHDPLFPPATAAAPDDAEQASEPTGQAAEFVRLAAGLWQANVTRIRTLERELRECRRGRKERHQGGRPGALPLDPAGGSGPQTP